jgi:hypothetical protein
MGGKGMDRDMGTHVGLANMALRVMQGDTIESFDEDSPTARTVRMYYFTNYANCLGKYPWTFATKQELLHALSQAPVGQYKHGYKLPIDTLSITWIRRGNGEGQVSVIDDVPYEVFSGDVVCTNAGGPLYIRYTYAPPVALLPAYFIDYFVSSLVEELSAVFGYNLEGQEVYHGRVFGKNGKLGYAIRKDRENRKIRTLSFDGIGNGRMW